MLLSSCFWCREIHVVVVFLRTVPFLIFHMSLAPFVKFATATVSRSRDIIPLFPSSQSILFAIPLADNGQNTHGSRSEKAKWERLARKERSKARRSRPPPLLDARKMVGRKHPCKSTPFRVVSPAKMSRGVTCRRGMIGCHDFIPSFYHHQPSCTHPHRHSFCVLCISSSTCKKWMWSCCSLLVRGKPARREKKNKYVNVIHRKKWFHKEQEERPAGPIMTCHSHVRLLSIHDEDQSGSYFACMSRRSELPGHYYSIVQIHPIPSHRALKNASWTKHGAQLLVW